MNNLFVCRGDITRVAADVIVYSTDQAFSAGGQLTAAFEEHVPGFKEAYEGLQAETGPAASRPPPGFSTWLELPGKGGRKGVVVTVATGGRTGYAERVRAATMGALRCAREALEAARVPKPWRISLPTFLTGHGGAWNKPHAVAVPQVETILDFFAETPDVDVAIVTYTEAIYYVVLHARREVRAARHLPPPLPCPPAALVDAFRRRAGVLFVGSGLSAGASLPSWASLIDTLAEELGIAADRRRNDLDDFLDIAAWYRDTRGNKALLEQIRRRFVTGNNDALPTVAHSLLGVLPLRWVVTTNYDDLLETSLRNLRLPVSAVVDEADIVRTGEDKGTLVVKFHGDAETGKGVVLGRDDYDDFFRTHPARAALLEGLLLNQTFLFVGYSLRDPDFRQVFHRISVMLREARRPAFATTFEALGPHTRHAWERRQMVLLDIPGESATEKSRALDVFLDNLAEAVADDPLLVLAPDSPRETSPRIAAVEEALLALGETVEKAARDPALSPAEAATLATIVRFLARLGWRANGASKLSNLFLTLASHNACAAGDRDALLADALRYVSSSGAAEQIEGLRGRRD